MLIAALLLISLGVVVIYTSSTTLALQQAIFAFFGLGFYFALKTFGAQPLRVLVKPLYLSVLVLLVVTALIGLETRGSTRWIPLGPFNFQPSEFAKPVLILVLAHFWSTRVASWKNIFLSALIYLPFGFLIFRQPDLGTALTISFIWAIMLIGANLSFFKMLTFTIIGILVAPLSWFTLHDYQKQRIASFLSPTQDPQGIGFHVIQSMIAVGSGQLTGRGLGRGTQSRLQFLPEFRTDFIFAFIAEELGFIGSALVLALYSVLFIGLLRLLLRTDDHFLELLVIGVMGMLFFQITVNIGMNTGLLPITGITLPLLSYGGSSLITTLISLGLIASSTKISKSNRSIEIFGEN